MRIALAAAVTAAHGWKNLWAADDAADAAAVSEKSLDVETGCVPRMRGCILH